MYNNKKRALIDVNQPKLTTRLNGLKNVAKHSESFKISYSG